MEVPAGYAFEVIGFDPEREAADASRLALVAGQLGNRGTPLGGHDAVEPLVLHAGVCELRATLWSSLAGPGVVALQATGDPALLVAASALAAPQGRAVTRARADRDRRARAAARSRLADRTAGYAHPVSGDHEHGGHTHGVSEDSDTTRLSIALALIVGFMATEVVVGILAHSLALLSDAAHMLTDAGALLMSLVVIRLMRRPSGGNFTFGLKRSEILSAQANGATLLVLAGLIVYEGINRLISPPPAEGVAILTVAIVGIAVNLLATWQLSRANRESMNIEGSFQHILTDLIAFIVTAIAGGIILATGWTRADGVAALVIAAVMLRSAWGLLRDSGRVLLEAAPADVDVDEIGRALAAHPRVENVHDLHVWQISSGFPSLSAHVLVGRGDDCHAMRRELEQLLDQRFGIEHTTLQVDHAAERRLMSIGGSRRLPEE